MSDQTVETPVLDLLARMNADSIEVSSLDPEKLMLVRIAALVAMDAPPMSYCGPWCGRRARHRPGRGSRRPGRGRTNRRHAAGSRRDRQDRACARYRARPRRTRERRGAKAVREEVGPPRGATARPLSVSIVLHGNHLSPQTLLQVAPGIRTRFDRAGHVLVDAPDGTVVDIGPRGYAILSSFSRGR